MRVLYDGQKPAGVGSLMRVGDWDSVSVGGSLLLTLVVVSAGLWWLTRNGK